MALCVHKSMPLLVRCLCWRPFSFGWLGKRTPEDNHPFRCFTHFETTFSPGISNPLLFRVIIRKGRLLPRADSTCVRQSWGAQSGCPSIGHGGVSLWFPFKATKQVASSTLNEDLVKDRPKSHIPKHGKCLGLAGLCGKASKLRCEDPHHCRLPSLLSEKNTKKTQTQINAA